MFCLNEPYSITHTHTLFQCYWNSSALFSQRQWLHIGQIASEKESFFKGENNNKQMAYVWKIRSAIRNRNNFIIGFQRRRRCCAQPAAAEGISSLFPRGWPMTPHWHIASEQKRCDDSAYKEHWEENCIHLRVHFYAAWAISCRKIITMCYNRHNSQKHTFKRSRWPKKLCHTYVPRRICISMNIHISISMHSYSYTAFIHKSIYPP